MRHFTVTDVHDPRWSAILNSCINFDFYHTQCYHILETGTKAVLLTAHFGDHLIAFPFLIRQIPNSDYFDCTSAYGYCGPVGSQDLANFSNDEIAFFWAETFSFFVSSKIIAAFSRLHPLIPHASLFDQAGQVKDINQTVSIDLRITEEEQKKQYRKSNKSELNQLRRKGYIVEEASDNHDIDEFIKIYHETMRRVNASENYFFTSAYFYKFLRNSCFKSKLLLAKKDGKVAAGAIFTITKSIMQYHLAATTEEFIKDTPMKLVLDTARLEGNALHLDFLHLGGGVGGNDNDSLFKFKSGFSDYRNQFQIWQAVIDQEVYDDLCSQANADQNSSFFPLYRS